MEHSVVFCQHHAIRYHDHITLTWVLLLWQRESIQIDPDSSGHNKIALSHFAADVEYYFNKVLKCVLDS